MNMNVNHRQTKADTQCKDKGKAMLGNAMGSAMRMSVFSEIGCFYCTTPHGQPLPKIPLSLITNAIISTTSAAIVNIRLLPITMGTAFTQFPSLSFIARGLHSF